MFLIGLTGGIASGKSTVANFFRQLGCPILDADLIAREVVQPNKLAWKKIVQYFGNEILLEDGQLNRPMLGQIVFSDPAKRKVLNSITHPEIQKSMMWQIFLHFIRGHQFVILDIPLLYEGSKMIKILKEVVVVSCDEETQLQRLMQRNSFTEEEAQSRIHAQMPLRHKCQLAHHVIDNTGSIEQTQEQVEALCGRFRRYYTHWVFRLVFLSGFALCSGTFLVVVRYVLRLCGWRK
ncbi:dephospho-CoA kinase domain-containing protein-like [Glandiceps talaboti]